MNEIWERVRLIWDWFGRVTAKALLGCACLYGWRCHLFGRAVRGEEFAQFMRGLLHYILG